jgi:hypothetical protein
MKNLRYTLLFVAVIFVCAACGSLPSGALSDVVGKVGAGASGGSAKAAATAAVEFQSGEVLASADTSPMAEAAYYVSKVLKDASPDTKNQAQVIMIEDGKKYWVNYVLNSRKANKADLVVGASILVLRGWANHDEISADAYRKDAWIIGNVTSTEELFKGNVEVGGQEYSIKYVRVPTDPIK